MTRKTKGLSIFIDMRDSSEMMDKIDVYRIFYNEFRNVKDEKIGDLKLNNFNLVYKAFIGDAVFLHYKGELTSEVFELLSKVKEKVLNAEQKSGCNFGIGVAHGPYENIEAGQGNKNLAAPLSQYVDHASKASGFAKKNSEYILALRTSTKGKTLNSNIAFKEFILEEQEKTKSNWNIGSKTSASKRNFRFDID